MCLFTLVIVYMNNSQIIIDKMLLKINKSFIPINESNLGSTLKYIRKNAKKF